MKALSTVILKSGREQSLAHKHPWIFSGAIAKVIGEVSDGCFVEVRDSSGRSLCWGHYFPSNSIAVRVISFDKVADEVSAISLALSSAISFRRSIGLFDNPTTNAFRLVNAEADSLPGLIVDIYNRAIVMQCHSSAMYRLRNEIAESLKDLLAERIDTIYVTRISSIGVGPSSNESAAVAQSSDVSVPASLASQQNLMQGEYLFGSDASCEFLENGISFSANWEKGQKTGFFLDQRNNRHLVKTLASNRVVLDAFCYSGGFTISALRGGALEVHSVDASSNAMVLVQNHLKLNECEENVKLYTEDCFDFLSNMEVKYDMIILDPPAFVKHQKALQRGLRGYETINFLAIDKIKKGGLIFTFSCSQLVSKDEFRKRIFLAGAKAKRSVRVLAELEQAPCHPVSLYHREGAYLKGLLLYIE